MHHFYPLGGDRYRCVPIGEDLTASQARTPNGRAGVAAEEEQDAVRGRTTGNGAGITQIDFIHLGRG
jgi:hypothetical protein